MDRNNHLAIQALFVLLPLATMAQIPYSTPGQTISETFDSGLPADAATLTWEDNKIFPGWYVYREGMSSPPDVYRITDGVSPEAQVYRWRSTGSGDGALGSKPKPSTGAIITGIRLTNKTGQTLKRITIGYTGEQWFESEALQNNRLAVSYQVGDLANLSDGSWTEIKSLQFNSPKKTGAKKKLNGNLDENREVFTPVEIEIVGWENGQDLWIRWYDAGSKEPDQGLAIDDVTFSAVP